MRKLAIDVVLLPSEAMMEYAIAVNQELIKGNPPKIILDKTSCLPHISLLMGCVAEKDLSQVSEIITAAGRSEFIFELVVAAAQADPMPDGKKVTVLNMAPDQKLQVLHETLIDRLQAFLSFDATADMLYNPPVVEEISLPFINNYLKKSSFANFSPHITAGIGTYLDGSYPIPFTAPSLALCHLGNYCTCRKVLHTVPLTG